MMHLLLLSFLLLIGNELLLLLLDHRLILLSNCCNLNGGRCHLSWLTLLRLLSGLVWSILEKFGKLGCPFGREDERMLQKLFACRSLSRVLDETLADEVAEICGPLDHLSCNFINVLHRKLRRLIFMQGKKRLPSR